MIKKIKVGLVLLIIFIISYTFYLYHTNKNTIIIGTKNFTEQKIIGYLLEDYIENQTDYEVKVLPGIGETSFLQSAILKNDLDIYVDYTSTAYQDVLGYTYGGETSQQIYNIVKTDYEQKYNLEWISLLGFENSNALVCKEFCIENDIQTISELAQYDNIKFGAPIQFFSRSDGLPLLQSTYGLEITTSNQISLDHSLAYTALDNNEIDVMLGFTTDAQLYNSDYIILEDDLHCFPIYDAGIVVSQQALQDYPELEKVLKDLNNTITNEEMQKLNYEVDYKHKNILQVAEEEYEAIIKTK